MSVLAPRCLCPRPAWYPEDVAANPAKPGSPALTHEARLALGFPAAADRSSLTAALLCTSTENNSPRCRTPAREPCRRRSTAPRTASDEANTRQAPAGQVRALGISNLELPCRPRPLVPRSRSLPPGEKHDAAVRLGCQVATTGLDREATTPVTACRFGQADHPFAGTCARGTGRSTFFRCGRVVAWLCAWELSRAELAEEIWKDVRGGRSVRRCSGRDDRLLRRCPAYLIQRRFEP